MIPHSRRRRFPFRLGELLTGAVLALPGCGDLQLSELNDALLTELQRLDACGPGGFEAFVPDCPLKGLCYTEACAAHDICYTTCGTDRNECDDQFRNTMQALCAAVFPIGASSYDKCRYAALTYWLAVSLLGREAFDIAQVLVCETTPPPPIERRGACCTYAEPPACTDDVLQTDCGPAGILIDNLSCDEIALVFGACPVPDNDSCETRAVICDGIVADNGLGQCAGAAQPDRGGGVCDLTVQDCPNSGPCLPVDAGVFRCTIPTDNRLATTDGPSLAGSCGPASPDSLQADVWYALTAPCDASLTIRMCAADTYDAMLAVYTHDASGSCTCPAVDEQPTACNDDFCFTFGSTSGLDLDVTEGQCIVLRVGGWASENNPATASRGRSELNIGFFCGETKTERAVLPRGKP